MILLPSSTSQSDLTKTSMLPTALYIHMPWCIRKCPYCDFNSHKSPDKLPEDQYIQALMNDFQNDLARHRPQTIHSIFIGGGTPSLFSGQSYEKLFHKLQELIPFSPNLEITLEANPGTVEHQCFKDFRQAGINRLSLGIQSFNPQHLKQLGRIHDDTQAHQAIEAARLAGFDNINLDLMHSLPGQTVEEGLEDLEQALSYQPEHLSWYQLTLEPNTVFYKQRPILPSEDTTDRMEEQGFHLLASQGYGRYEISAFCKDGFAAQHNLNYWLFGDYFGIGAGAHGKLTMAPQHILRTWKYRQPNDYLKQTNSFLAGEETVLASSLVFEFMLNTTRLQQPIPYSLFTERTGLPFHHVEAKLQEAAKLNLITLHNQYWQITDFGRRFTNNLQSLFLP